MEYSNKLGGSKDPLTLLRAGKYRVREAKI